jgi:hypothetical protein
MAAVCTFGGGLQSIRLRRGMVTPFIEKEWLIVLCGAVRWIWSRRFGRRWSSRFGSFLIAGI